MKCLARRAADADGNHPEAQLPSFVIVLAVLDAVRSHGGEACVASLCEEHAKLLNAFFGVPDT